MIDARLIYFQERFRAVVAKAIGGSKELQSLQAQLEDRGYDFDFVFGVKAMRRDELRPPLPSRKRQRLSKRLTKNDRLWLQTQGIRT